MPRPITMSAKAPAITLGPDSAPAPPSRIRATPISYPGPSDISPVPIQNPEKTAKTIALRKKSFANQRSWTVAGQLIRKSSRCCGSMPVVLRHKRLSPVAPRTISCLAILRMAGRQPSKPAKSPRAYAQRMNQTGTRTILAGFQPNHWRKRCTTSANCSGSGPATFRQRREGAFSDKKN